MDCNEEGYELRLKDELKRNFSLEIGYTRRNIETGWCNIDLLYALHTYPMERLGDSGMVLHV